MSTLVRDEGIILRTIRHGDTSTIITVFTRSHGKIGMISKGARRRIKNGSPLALELFTEAEFVYYYKATRDLQLLKELALQDPHLGIRDSLSGITLGSAILELLLCSLHEDDPHESLFAATRDALRAMDSSQGVLMPLLWKYELILFRTLGFGLQTKKCAASGKPLVPPFNGPIRYRCHDGIFLAPGVSFSETVDGTLSLESFALLSRLSEASYQFAGRLKVNEATEQELTRFLQRYFESHLPVKGKLRSLEALRWSRNT
ncbi:DNA repair protein RecO [bacterium]|nr:MAG: DNA repair protein RecO [bacterium]